MQISKKNHNKFIKLTIRKGNTKTQELKPLILENYHSQRKNKIK